jgi:trehalose-6-phosphate hydrolase
MQTWQHSVIYQIYPKSFHSHAGNATGDLLGIVDKLDYLQWLGVDCLWITPFLRSPQRDNGYDISDYYAIDPSYGTMADCDLLISEAAKRGIKLMLDIVVNHTSIEHEWFQQARSSLDNPYRDFYIWRDQPNTGNPSSAARPGSTRRKPGSTFCTCSITPRQTSTGTTRRCAPRCSS